jgi:hypothetical protein
MTSVILYSPSAANVEAGRRFGQVFWVITQDLTTGDSAAKYRVVATPSVISSQSIRCEGATELGYCYHSHTVPYTLGLHFVCKLIDGEVIAREEPGICAFQILVGIEATGLSDEEVALAHDGRIVANSDDFGHLNSMRAIYISFTYRYGRSHWCMV